jgi:hypothetical protein
MGLLYLFYFH